MIDPWASTSVDYDKLINQFGIEKISDIKWPNAYRT